MKKRILLLVLVVLLAVPAQAFAVSSTDTGAYTIKASTDYSTQGIVTIPKTITKTYSSQSSIPTSVYYEEYTMGTWFRGTLYLYSVVKSGTVYKATFTGTLTGYVQ